mmetsp:Transcript_3251/g.10163  ORF Transcript_3251/g.10163 Transcript_3251/m.10163 type:complete len:210 (+) Transcript_3251:1411-2040(+)
MLAQQLAVLRSPGLLAQQRPAAAEGLRVRAARYEAASAPTALLAPLLLREWLPLLGACGGGGSGGGGGGGGSVGARWRGHIAQHTTAAATLVAGGATLLVHSVLIGDATGGTVGGSGRTFRLRERWRRVRMAEHEEDIAHHQLGGGVLDVQLERETSVLEHGQALLLLLASAKVTAPQEDRLGARRTEARTEAGREAATDHRRCAEVVV